MCFYFHQSKTATELKQRFKAQFNDETVFLQPNYNAFEFPQIPVITNHKPDTIQFFNWGLIPHWAKDSEIRKNTLNARIETLSEKPSFRSSITKRCLIPADGYYEWQWLDAKGKLKQKYNIILPNGELFAFAGLWSEWVDTTSGEVVYSCTILTTEANELMSKIHNSKKRMPVILNPNLEQQWLQGQAYTTQDIALIANKI